MIRVALGNGQAGDGYIPTGADVEDAEVRAGTRSALNGQAIRPRAVDYHRPGDQKLTTGEIDWAQNAGREGDGGAHAGAGDDGSQGASSAVVVVRDDLVSTNALILKGPDVAAVSAARIGDRGTIHRTGEPALIGRVSPGAAFISRGTAGEQSTGWSGSAIIPQRPEERIDV